MHSAYESELEKNYLCACDTYRPLLEHWKAFCLWPTSIRQYAFEYRNFKYTTARGAHHDTDQSSEIQNPVESIARYTRGEHRLNLSCIVR